MLDFFNPANLKIKEMGDNKMQKKGEWKTVILTTTLLIQILFLSGLLVSSTPVYAAENKVIHNTKSALEGQFIEIAGGSTHSLALKNNGTVWAWGKNTFGQLGYRTKRSGIALSMISSTTPAQVSGLSDMTAIAAGGSNSMALKSDGTVWAWGFNEYGQLGDGRYYYSQRSVVKVSGLNQVTALAGGGFHSMALKPDGTVWAWGDNRDGQLGIGMSPSKETIPRWVCGTPELTTLKNEYNPNYESSYKN